MVLTIIFIIMWLVTKTDNTVKKVYFHCTSSCVLYAALLYYYQSHNNKASKWVNWTRSMWKNKWSVHQKAISCMYLLTLLKLTFHYILQWTSMRLLPGRIKRPWWMDELSVLQLRQRKWHQLQLLSQTYQHLNDKKMQWKESIQVVTMF